MLVHSIESLAALDGEGLRYEIFLAGCPLRCIYCHNPDTWTRASGKEMSEEELLKKIKRYVPYFGDDGGVTFSGGEPLLQAGSINILGSMLKKEGINYALDTSGCIELTDEVKDAVKGADTVICDLKFPDRELMKKNTTGDLDLVLNFLDFLRSIKKKTWIRTVIVPGINDSTEMLDRYIEVLKPYKDIIKKYELLGFHTMGFYKYDNLGIKNPLEGVSALDPDKLIELKKYIASRKPD